MSRKPSCSGSKRRLRCAIYTRKSTEEGLDQDFNSLDAQREACEAYIKSQKHEGWTALPEMYDDGAASRGRPPSARRSGGFWSTLRRGGSTRWWSTRSIA